MITTSPKNERRDSDRRHRRSWGSRHFWLGGRRFGPRRADESGGWYTDVYGPGVAANVVIVMTGCVMDALLTLSLLEKGAVEVNPLMALALLFGVRQFVLLKVVLTGLCLLLLTVHHRFLLYRRLRVHQLLACLAFAYLTLLLYELGLMRWVY